MQHGYVTAFVRALSHRERCEAYASVHSHGSTTEIVYTTPLHWPWPRKFVYVNEFFCTEFAPLALSEVQASDGSRGEHVINFFAANLKQSTQHFFDAGYTEAWTSILLGRSLSKERHRTTPDNVNVHQVRSGQDMERYKSLSGISNPAAPRDAHIHNYFAVSGAEVVAKGQFVLLPGSVAYISDMYTRPEHRRTGLCNLIMQALESGARLRGATHACLAPGREVASFGLYEKYGYEPVCSRSILIPATAASAA